MAANERSSPDMSTLGSRAMRDPASLTLDEIRSLGACVVTQAPDHSSPGAHAIYNRVPQLTVYNALTIARRYAPPPAVAPPLGALPPVERNRLAGEPTLADVLLSHYGPDFEVTKRSV